MIAERDRREVFRQTKRQNQRKKDLEKIMKHAYGGGVVLH